MSRNQIIARSRGMNRVVACGFSLVEMLLVIAVIALLIAMLMPALAGARDSALRVKTQSMMADLTNAAQRFGNDNAGRNPGYFSESVMGSSDNQAVGMSAMENAMLELGGSAAILGSADDPDVAATDPELGIIEIAPSADPAVVPVVVNINLIGAEGAYYTPELKFWKAQVHDPAVAAGQAGTPAGEGQEFMPDLLDAWGNPMLAWAKDPAAPGSVLATSDPNEVYTQIARLNSDGPGDLGDPTGPAWFYLASNAAFLEAPGFGDAGINMAGNPANGRASTLGSGVTNVNERLQTLGSVLASSSSFQLDPNVDGLEDADADQVFPTHARGRFIVHSAGSDGVFLNHLDEGWKENGHTNYGGGSYYMDFGNSYFSHGNERYTDDNGAFTNIDLMDPFDDLLFGAK
ncbi:MAG: prepilin-type N-terminal cleavage/methylation domain-containing protein [Phycisphaerales bacterium]